MKSLLISLFVGLLCCQVSAQECTGSFWDFEQGCPDQVKPFFVGCISNASSSHGTPDNALPSTIQDPTPASNGGTRYAHMYSRFVASCQNGTGFKGEGILLHFNFVANRTYRIRFIGRMSPPASNTEMRLILVNDMPNESQDNHTAGCESPDNVPAIPAINKNVKTFGGSSFPSSSWANFSEIVTPGMNFNQLWFRPLTFGPNEGGVNWYIDNVCIEEINCPLECTQLTASDISGQSSLCTANTGNYAAVIGNYTPSCEAPTWSVTPANGLQIVGQNVTPSGLATLNLLAQTQGNYTITFTVFPCGGDPIVKTLRVVVCNAIPYTPISPPIDLNYICTAENEKCYTFNDLCITSYVLSTPDTKLVIDQTGTTICLSSVWFKKRVSPLYVTAVNACGSGSTETWNILIDYPQFCGGGSPGHIASEPAAADDRNSGSEKPVLQSTLYPNPVSNSSVVLQAGVTDGESYTVTIYNATGQLVKTYTDVSDAALVIEQGALQAGAHIVQVKFADGRQEVLKLIVL